MSFFSFVKVEMPQGTFTASNSGRSTTNYSFDTCFYFLGGAPFTGPPVDWTQVVNGYTSGAMGPFTCDWIITGPGMVGASGKILSITFSGSSGGGDGAVLVTLQLGGGTFVEGAGNIFTPPPPCFVEGTRVLSDKGYKPIETLMMKDLMVLSDGRVVDYNMMKIVVETTTTATAPYRISAGAFGSRKPAADICLSPHHKIQIRPGVWISPERAALVNPKVKQYGVGEPITYWHIACDDYLKDNLVCEGLVVESLATNKNYTGPARVYTWSDRLGGFTRPAANKVLKQLAK